RDTGMRKPLGSAGAHDGITARPESAGAERLPPDEMQDADQDAGADQRDHELGDQTLGFRAAQRAEDRADDPAADDAADHAQDDVDDDAVPLAAHDLAGKPTGYATDDDEADEVQHGDLLCPPC